MPAFVGMTAQSPNGNVTDRRWRVQGKLLSYASPQIEQMKQMLSSLDCFPFSTSRANTRFAPTHNHLHRLPYPDSHWCKRQVRFRVLRAFSHPSRFRFCSRLSTASPPPLSSLNVQPLFASAPAQAATKPSAAQRLRFVYSFAPSGAFVVHPQQLPVDAQPAFNRLRARTFKRYAPGGASKREGAAIVPPYPPGAARIANATATQKVRRFIIATLPCGA